MTTLVQKPNVFKRKHILTCLLVEKRNSTNEQVFVGIVLYSTFSLSCDFREVRRQERNIEESKNKVEKFKEIFKRSEISLHILINKLLVKVT